MAEIQHIWMFHTGRLRLPRGLLEAGAGSERCWLPILSFLLIHPSQPILVDTGFSRRPLELEGRWWSKLTGPILARLAPDGPSCRDGIAACGVEPDQVERGILTHLHWDHTGGIAELPRTRFAAARRELRVARSFAGLSALTRGYAPRDEGILERIEALDFQADDDVAPFDCALDLLGDGSVKLLPTPGHSPGHTSLLVRGKGGREVLLAGDAAFTQGHILANLNLGPMPRRFAADLPGTRDTLHQLQALVRRRPGMRVYTSHDPDQGDDVADGPIDILRF